MQFEQLDPKKHNCKSFNCGVSALNLYLQRFANQDQKRSLTRIYVLEEKKRIIGYYSISAHSVMRDNLPNNINLASYKDLPFLLLGRLAVDINYQGQGYGDTLMYHAFKITLNIAKDIGILGIVVDAKNSNAISFYEGFGFIKLQKIQNRLVLPLSTIAKLVEK